MTAESREEAFEELDWVCATFECIVCGSRVALHEVRIEEIKLECGCVLNGFVCMYCFEEGIESEYHD